MQVSQEAGQVVWNSHFFQNSAQFIVIHTVKGFGVVNKAEIDVFTKALADFIYFFFFWTPKSLQMVTAAMKVKDAYSLEGKLWPT